MSMDGAPEQCAANAHLISAAPDLLEALKWATRQIGILYPYIETTEAQAKFDACEAAIRKATDGAASNPERSGT